MTCYYCGSDVYRNVFDEIHPGQYKCGTNLGNRSERCRIIELEKKLATALREKEDMRQRNDLLRRRADLAPEQFKPRLAILKRLDRLVSGLETLAMKYEMQGMSVASDLRKLIEEKD